MKCRVCGKYLAESHLGKENHMKLYHSVPPKVNKQEYIPLDPKVKEEQVKRMEVKFGLVGDGPPLAALEELDVNDGSAIDNAKLDLYGIPVVVTPKLTTSPVLVENDTLRPPLVQISQSEIKSEFSLEKRQLHDLEPITKDVSKPRMTSEEFMKCLDSLEQRSKEALEVMRRYYDE